METSEDERRRYRGRSLKKKTMNASMKFTNTLRKRGKRVANCRYASISIEDVRDAEEEEAVNAFREALLANNLLPDRFDDYHTMLRLVNCHIFVPYQMQILTMDYYFELRLRNVWQINLVSCEIWNLKGRFLYFVFLTGCKLKFRMLK